VPFPAPHRRCGLCFPNGRRLWQDRGGRPGRSVGSAGLPKRGGVAPGEEEEKEEEEHEGGPFFFWRARAGLMIIFWSIVRGDAVDEQG
jgi:hypothetical protein